MSQPVQTTLLFLTLLLLPSCALAETVTLATHELPPYGYHDSAHVFTGYAVERVRFAVARCGLELSIVVVPWARAQALAGNDFVDGFFAASLNDERMMLYAASEVLAPQRWTWFLLHDSPLDPAAADFKAQARVGSFIGANMLKYLEENGYHIAGTPKDTEALFLMLMAGRLDAFLANDMVAGRIIEDQGLGGKIRTHTLKSEALHALFTRRFIREHPDFLECFNAGLAEYEMLHHSKK